MNVMKWAWLFLMPGWWPQAEVSQQEIDLLLARAEALYYEARFDDSIELLLPLEDAAPEEFERPEQQVQLNLQLALSHIGRNDLDEARARFRELLELDPDYELDPQLYAPKVVMLFDEAKALSADSRCREICRVAVRRLEAADAEGVLREIEAAPSCACVARTAVDAAEFFYQQGLAAYRSRNYAQAFEGFTSAVALNGTHAAARNELERTGERLQRETDAILRDWRQQFEAGEYAEARESYRRLRALNVRGRTESDLDRLEARYRESLSRVVASWNRACANRDLTAMEALEREAGLLRPDPGVGDDLVAQMTCEVQDCLPMPPELAIRRITSRVSPDIPATDLASGTVVRARLRIDEDGAAAVSSIDGGDAAVRRSIRAAVGQWTFVPAVIGGQGHCLETEFSFAVPPVGP